MSPGRLEPFCRDCTHGASENDAAARVAALTIGGPAITSDYIGIDYSGGTANRDAVTGIRYGVISQHSVMPEALDDVEYDWPRGCPYCGSEDIPEDTGELRLTCGECGREFRTDEALPDEPAGFKYEADGYKPVDCLQSDIFVLASPYYTHAQFCSPCVPGAGNLDSPVADGPRTYCLGHDWFKNGRAPYPVFRVSDNSEVQP